MFGGKNSLVLINDKRLLGFCVCCDSHYFIDLAVTVVLIQASDNRRRANRSR